MKLCKTLIIILIISGLLLAGEKNEKTGSSTPTFKEVLNLKLPGGPLISPDGKYILYSVREADWDQNEYFPDMDGRD
jgi:hypothetical protein